MDRVLDKLDKEPCGMCLSARVSYGLDDYNDYSAISIGETFSDKRRFMLCSGAGRPVRIEFDMFCETDSLWHTYGFFYPKYCPNCGRKLLEYDIDYRGRKFLISKEESTHG